MSAILFGSISTVADTSELQREAFNQAFEDSGLDWRWDRQDYQGMLAGSGGQARIEAYATSVGQTVDAAALHQAKSRIFQQRLAQAGVSARPGVIETIKQAKENDVKVGLVTTTSPDNISALLAALGPGINASDFDVIVDATKVDRSKPDRAAYVFALQEVNEESGQCVAIEDNVEGAESASAANVTCIAFPNENTIGQEFRTARERVDHLDFSEIQQLIVSA